MENKDFNLSFNKMYEPKVDSAVIGNHLCVPEIIVCGKDSLMDVDEFSIKVGERYNGLDPYKNEIEGGKEVVGFMKDGDTFLVTYKYQIEEGVFRYGTETVYEFCQQNALCSMMMERKNSEEYKALCKKYGF